MGGAARYATELQSYLARTGRDGRPRHRWASTARRSWLAGAPGNLGDPVPARRVAVNNVSFVAPGDERWTRLRNALHFLTDDEADRLDPSLRASVRREAAVVRLAARRADVLVVPCSGHGRAGQPEPAPPRSRIVPRASGLGHTPSRSCHAIRPSCARSCSRPTSGWTNASRSSSPP